MEAIGLLAGGVAHGLNNILSGIVGYPDLLLLDLPKDSPIRRPIEVIKESGQRAADVVSDLLTVARGIASSREVSNLNFLVQEYLGSPEHKRLESMHPSIAFETVLEPELLNVSFPCPYQKEPDEPGHQCLRGHRGDRYSQDIHHEPISG
jgi:two-component system cell cycle sensor histidine kinase/response regulator CckA